MSYQITITWLHIAVATYIISNIFIVGLMMGVNADSMKVRSWRDLFAIIVTTLIYLLVGLVFLFVNDFLWNTILVPLWEWIKTDTLIKFYYKLWTGQYDKMEPDALYSRNYHISQLRKKDPKTLTRNQRLLIKSTDIINERNKYTYKEKE